jgi:gamma-glutamylcyclotransferase (GGCT)/AIG2-like uncharacterized protein YtfP
VRAHYFAYGSNLALECMRERVPAADVIGRARLVGMRLTLDKLGRDGSGKANLVEDALAHVWGVVYGIDTLHWSRLDASEPGYRRIIVWVETEGGSLEAETYCSTLRTDDPVALAWYKRLIVEGARAQGLPAAYRALLEALPVRAESD